jgi:hypothetical protein
VQSLTCVIVQIVPLARHSTLPELQRFVSLFKPKRVVPNTVSPRLGGADWACIPIAFGPCMAPGGAERVKKDMRANGYGMWLAGDDDVRNGHGVGTKTVTRSFQSAGVGTAAMVPHPSATIASALGLCGSVFSASTLDNFLAPPHETGASSTIEGLFSQLGGVGTYAGLGGPESAAGGNERDISRIDDGRSACTLEHLALFLPFVKGEEADPPIVGDKARAVGIDVQRDENSQKSVPNYEFGAHQSTVVGPFPSTSQSHTLPTKAASIELGSPFVLRGHDSSRRSISHTSPTDTVPQASVCPHPFVLEAPRTSVGPLSRATSSMLNPHGRTTSSSQSGSVLEPAAPSSSPRCLESRVSFSSIQDPSTIKQIHEDSSKSTNPPMPTTELSSPFNIEHERRRKRISDAPPSILSPAPPPPIKRAKGSHTATHEVESACASRKIVGQTDTSVSMPDVFSSVEVTVKSHFGRTVGSSRASVSSTSSRSSSPHIPAWNSKPALVHGNGGQAVPTKSSRSQLRSLIERCDRARRGASSSSFKPPSVNQPYVSGSAPRLSASSRTPPPVARERKSPSRRIPGTQTPVIDMDSCTTVPETPASAASAIAKNGASPISIATPSRSPLSLPWSDTSPGSVDTRLIRKINYRLDSGSFVTLDCLY